MDYLLVDTVYHAFLRFITNCNTLTPLYIRQFWVCSITTCVCIMQKSAGQYSLRPQSFCMLSVPNTCAEIGKRAFVYSAPAEWNTLQKDLKLNELIFFTLL